MSEHVTFPPPSRPESATTSDPRVVRAEQRLAMLRELGELGIALAWDLTRRTLEVPDEAEAASAPCASPWRRRLQMRAPRRPPLLRKPVKNGRCGAENRRLAVIFLPETVKNCKKLFR
ncbi:MAG TPA: hypothetical protein VFC47_15400 [Caulobacteraceae bacterium]|nr:hypothetical protein [Caulobacteraceae bacterium]